MGAGRLPRRAPDAQLRLGAAEAGVLTGAPTPLGEALHARGLRLTPQRQRVLDAVRALGHGTPEEVLAHLRAAGGTPAVDASTVYRALALLEELGLVARTGLDRRADSFHPVEHGGHLHLVCDGCGSVAEAPADAAGELAAELRRRTGFSADVTHLALRGRCAACRRDDPREQTREQTRDDPGEHPREGRP